MAFLDHSPWNPDWNEVHTPSELQTFCRELGEKELLLGFSPTNMELELAAPPDAHLNAELISWLVDTLCLHYATIRTLVEACMGFSERRIPTLQADAEPLDRIAREIALRGVRIDVTGDYKRITFSCGTDCSDIEPQLVRYLSEFEGVLSAVWRYGLKEVDRGGVQ